MKGFWAGLALLSAVAGEATTGTIVGKVGWEGAVPDPRKLPVDRDNAACECDAGTGERRPFKLDESLVVDPDGKGVANAVLWLKGVKGGPVLGPAEISQKGCVYTPHVSLLTPGQGLRLLNPDRIIHTFQLWPERNPPANISIPKVRRVVEVPEGHFRIPEFIRATCAPHAWMSCWIAVVENGYAARTDGKGGFRIEGVPPGKYTLALWHEPLTPDGRPFLLEKEVVVEAGKEAEAGFTLGAKP